MEGEYDYDFESIKFEFEGGFKYEATKIEIRNNFVDDIFLSFFAIDCYTNVMLHLMMVGGIHGI
jgi:hypothetical protein